MMINDTMQLVSAIFVGAAQPPNAENGVGHNIEKLPMGPARNLDRQVEG
jgi:hypothetical protein